MFKYIETNSNIHKIGPTYKIISLFIFFILFIFTNNFSYSFIMFLFSTIISLLTKVSYRHYLNRLTPVSIVSIIILIIGLITNINTYSIVLKLLALSLYYSSYIFTTKFVDTNKGIYDILNTFEIRNYRLNLYITVIIHFISIVYEEYYSINNGNLLHKLYYTIDIVIVRLKQIINLNKVKTYNFKFAQKRNNLIGSIALISHVLLFMLYFLGKV